MFILTVITAKPILFLIGPLLAVLVGHALAQGVVPLATIVKVAPNPGDV
jgi:hypothetical protein